MAEQTIIPPGTADLPSQCTARYGSVIARFIAMMIDWFVVFVFMLILFIPLFLISLLGSLIVAPILAMFNLTLIPSFMLLMVLGHWIYYATMESGERGATYGKRLMGLRVVDDKGGQISFARASLRYFAKLISAIPLMLGFVMAIFTAKKQALHDLIAETIVVRG